MSWVFPSHLLIIRIIKQNVWPPQAGLARCYHTKITGYYLIFRTISKRIPASLYQISAVRSTKTTDPFSFPPVQVEWSCKTSLFSPLLTLSWQIVGFSLQGWNSILAVHCDDSDPFFIVFFFPSWRGKSRHIWMPLREEAFRSWKKNPRVGFREEICYSQNHF